MLQLVQHLVLHLQAYPMDKAAAIHAKTKELDEIHAYLNHPITQRILRDNQEQENALIDLICDAQIDSIAGFFAHFQAVGHLRGLRRGRALVMDSLETVNEELKELH